ncbi:unnamed protein product [Gadus morhua 'NCC']
MDDMRSAFVQPALTLSVSTLPHIDPRLLCSLPPRRSDDPTTDIFSQDQEDILDDVSGLTVDSPDGTVEEGSRMVPPSPGGDPPKDLPPNQAEQKGTEQDTAFCRGLHDMNPPEAVPSSSFSSASSSTSSSSSSLPPSPVSPAPPGTPAAVAAAAAAQRQLSHADKLRKVISELVDTEKTYVKDLGCLIERFLKPLQKESFLTQDELDVLFGNLDEMLVFQVEFLQTLEDGIRLVPDLDKLERVEQFKKVLFSLGSSFLYYADRFKIYSAFCASHTKVPKVLTKAKTDPDFKAFLALRNPRQQHSSTLESYLIKPIQRVLKYPLLLRELYSLTDPESEEHYHLDVAVKTMNEVASHINEMQKLHEEYGAVFDQLINEQTLDKKESRVADLTMGDLLVHKPVTWINPPSALVKSKKDPELAAFVFKTAVVFVYKNCTKQRRKIGASHRSSVTEDRDPVRFRHMISTDSLQVRPLANSEDTAVCEIVHTRSESVGRPERTFQLSCSSPDNKKEFLKAVHSVLREKQRRQLLKTDSLPSGQQYVPFGGKRLCPLKGSRPTMDRAVTCDLPEPSRTLRRRKLTRNRFTIDTDLVLHAGDPLDHPGPPSDRPPSTYHYAPLAQYTPRPPPPPPPQQQQQQPQAGVTDLWVEEQFDLARYGEVETDAMGGLVKETDILSDDDEFCNSVRGGGGSTTSTGGGAGPLEGSLESLGLRDAPTRGAERVSRPARGGARAEEGGYQGEHRCDDADSFPPPGRRDVPAASPPLTLLAPLKHCAAARGAADTARDPAWARRDDFGNRRKNDVF